MEKKLTEKDKKRQYYMRIIIISVLAFTLYSSISKKNYTSTKFIIKGIIVNVITIILMNIYNNSNEENFSASTFLLITKLTIKLFYDSIIGKITYDILNIE